MAKENKSFTHSILVIENLLIFDPCHNRVTAILILSYLHYFLIQTKIRALYAYFSKGVKETE